MDGNPITEADLPAIKHPLEDGAEPDHCLDIATQVNVLLGIKMKEQQSVPRNAFAKYLKVLDRFFIRPKKSA